MFSLMASLATSRDCVKGGSLVSRPGLADVTIFPPLGTMPYNPIGQSTFKADVRTGFLRLDPFMFQNFLTLGLELAIQRGVLEQIRSGRGTVFSVCGHSCHTRFATIM